MKTKVSIVNVTEYNSVPEAVEAAIKLIEKDLPFDFTKSDYILLKPNLLSAEKDATTQPSFVEGVISYLKNIGVSIKNAKIGDSPGQFKKNASYVAEKIGLSEICEREGLEFVNFESEIPVEEAIEDAIRMKKFLVSKPVKDCDILINLPKLKTHAEATITGAIKNYWGIIPGGLKARYHLLGNTAMRFGEVLADNFSWLVRNKPNRLTVYDLHRIMQGPRGPNVGDMINWNLILAGTDELAMDLIALEIGKFDGLKFVPHLKNVAERNLGISNFADIEIVGVSLDEAKRKTPRFKVPGSFMTSFVSYLTGHLGYKIMKKIPFLNRRLCVKCGECAEICPAEAIEFKPRQYPSYLRKKCISCLCCMELCPQHAIEARTRGLMGLFD